MRPATRVPVTEATTQPAPRVQDIRPKVPTKVTSKPPAPRVQKQVVEPVAARTRAARLAASKISSGPAGNTRSKATNVLQMALHAACYTDGGTSEAKRLARRRYPAAMFSAALAVMDIESGKMLKHRQLINHSNNNTRETWQKSTANEIGRLF